MGFGLTDVFGLRNQVVLARNSRIITDTDIDPIAWLAQLQVCFISGYYIVVNFQIKAMFRPRSHSYFCVTA